MQLGWFLRSVAAGAFVMAMALPSAPAQAAYNYDSTITAVYGSGNPNDHWTVSSENPPGVGVIVTGLRAVNRFGASIAPASGTGNYLVEAGPYPGAPALALWNFTFSIDTSGTNLTLSGLNAWLTVTPASTGTPSTPFDLLSITDNAPAGSTKLAQNSENLGFGGGGFNPSAIDTYTLTLNLVPKAGGAPLVTNSINVTTFNASPVPEPASMALLGAGLFGLGLIRRRRRA